MAPGQVHDINYRLDYNERQGNSSQWCLCIDDFKPRTMHLSHADTESTNKQHSSSAFVQLNQGDVTLIRLEMAKQYWIKTDGRISVGMCLYESLKLVFIFFKKCSFKVEL